MNIEDELISFLKSHIRESDYKKRNINAIAYYYGFGVSSWPTLEDTANQFPKPVTNERFRQIKKKYFIDIADLKFFPATKNIFRVIKSKRFWPQSELEKRILELEAARDRFSIRGLFNLMKDLGTDHVYKIYTPDLREATRNSIDKYEQNFIIRDSDIKIIKSIYRKAQGLPGRCGISNIKTSGRWLLSPLLWISEKCVQKRFERYLSGQGIGIFMIFIS